MSQKLKSGLLLFMLVGPLLFFGLFHLFGTNHYSIKKYYPLGLDKNNDTIYHTIPDFKFENQNGKEITKSDYKDKIFVVDFFFTSCPTICPVMSKNIAYLQNGFKNHDEVMFLSHSVDPEDNQEKLKEYAKLYEAKDGVWNLVTGDKNEIYRQAVEGYKIIAAENDGFVHSEKLVLVDKNFVIRGYYDGTKEKEVENLLSEIRILMYEQND